MTKEIILDKKIVSLYKNILKRMLVSVTKFGSSKRKDDLVYLYHYINKDNDIFPVLLLNQTKSPWGDEFYPANLFIVGNNFPKDINIFDTDSNKNYRITDSVKINIAEFKKSLSDIKDLSINYIGNRLMISLPDIVSNTNDRNIGYVDKFKNMNSISKVLSISEDKFNIITDDVILKSIHAEICEKTQCSIQTTDKGNVLKLFFSVAPIKMDRLDYIRMLSISDNDITSQVYCKQYISNIVIHNFYRYVDIWNIVDKKGVVSK